MPTVANRAMEIARGIVRAGSRTSSPIVAIRAYPAKAKKSRPAACSTPYAPALVDHDGTSAAEGDTTSTATTVARTTRVQATRMRVRRAVLVTPR